MKKPLLLVDFDGVLAKPTCTGVPDLVGPPYENARTAMYMLQDHFTLVCFSARRIKEPVERWLQVHGFPPMRVTNVKESGLILDDNCITFSGQWDDATVDQIKKFQPHWNIS